MYTRTESRSIRMSPGSRPNQASAPDQTSSPTTTSTTPTADEQRPGASRRHSINPVRTAWM